jgi:hypothetical protein
MFREFAGNAISLNALMQPHPVRNFWYTEKFQACVTLLLQLLQSNSKAYSECLPFWTNCAPQMAQHAEAGRSKIWKLQQPQNWSILSFPSAWVVTAKHCFTSWVE